MQTCQQNQQGCTELCRRQSVFQGLGWKIRLQQKRTNYFLTLAKEIVVGNALKKGDEVFYYLVDCDGRKGILVFLDGKERQADDAIKLKETVFLIKK